MPVCVRSPVVLDLVLDPLGVFVDELQDLLAKLLLPVAVALHGVEPVHVQQVRGHVTLEKSGGKRLKQKETNNCSFVAL